MKPFDVLSRHENLTSSRLLEASAGTGKTHAIENIVARLLIDDAAVELEKILIVTFTRAATEELKVRVHKNLCKVASLCKDYLLGEIHESPIDYLQALFEKGQAAVRHAYKLVEQALAGFDVASIFTIHAFCQRMLKEFLFEGHFPAENREMTPTEVYQLIRDFFRTALDETLLTPEQLQRVLAHCRSIEQLEKKLYQLSLSNIELSLDMPLPALQQKFYQAMHSLKQKLQLESSKIMQDFYLQAPAYKEICDAKKRPKASNVAKAQAFADLFDKAAWDAADFDVLVRDGLYFVEAFSDSNRDRRKQAPSDTALHYPLFVSMLESSLGAVVRQARHADRILVTLAAGCRKLIKAYFAQEGILNFNDMLDSMQQALQHANFVHQVQERFAVAIIDEFQDTDPQQWHIFEKLFLNSHSRLFLVGDPKQSIYAFRQADIYTYLAAAEMLGHDKQATLAVNYRSTTSLVQALNYLFSENLLDSFMPLPRYHKTLPYRPVESCGLVSEKFVDAYAAVNFMAVPVDEKGSLSEIEEKYYLPFIVDELINLHASRQLSFNDCAILVADRFQAERVSEYLKRCCIPCHMQRHKSLVQASSFLALKDLLQAVLYPKNENLLKIALGGPICCWNEHDLIRLDDMFYRARIVADFIKLRKIWQSLGFCSFFQTLLAFSFHPAESSLVEKMLAKQDGDELYRHLLQLSLLLGEEEHHRQLMPHQLVDFFDELEKWDADEATEVKALLDPSAEAVVVMTMHASKGLEFEVVFALGAIRRSRSPDLIVPVAREGQKVICEVADSETDARYQLHSQELDAEKLRQLYVAWTRAKQRLYIPLLEGEGRRRLESFSAMDLYVQKVQQKAASCSVTMLELFLGRRLPHDEQQAKLLHSQDYSIAYLRLEPAVGKRFEREVKVPTRLVIPPTAQIPCKVEMLHSFNSLYPVVASQSTLKSSFQKVMPYDFNAEVKNVHSLPVCIELESLWHAIIGHIPIAILCKDSNEALLRPYVAQVIMATPFAAWEEVLITMVNNAWRASIPTNAGFLSLQDIEEWDVCRAYEFLFPTAGLTDLAISPGYLHGMIDLICRKEDKYYLINWKSHWLGSDATAYQPKHLQQVMQESDYLSQAKIYVEAFKRYLAICDDRPFEELFGGLYFFFLRGLSAGSSCGIYDGTSLQLPTQHLSLV